MSKRRMKQSDYTFPIPEQGPTLKQSHFTVPVTQAAPPRREMDMSTPKTACELDEMTSAEYAKYIRYNASKETASEVAPVVLEDDPSMASVAGVTPTEVSVAVAPVVPVVPVVPVAPVELRYEYQPTDEHGRPLGGNQVIMYTTPVVLASNLVEKNTQLVR